MDDTENSGQDDIVFEQPALNTQQVSSTFLPWDHKTIFPTGKGRNAIHSGDHCRKQ